MGKTSLNNCRRGIANGTVDIKNIENDYSNLREDEFREKYDFSKSSGKTLLRENGLIPETTSVKAPVAQLIISSDIGKSVYISKSEELDRKIDERIKKLYAANPQYRHKQIFNAILEAGLKHYGF